VDVGALEALLERAPAAMRLPIIVSCLSQITPGERSALGLPSQEVPPASPKVMPEGPLPAGQLRFLDEPHYDLQLDFDNPELERLWRKARGLPVRHS
jgi:hypothetical protein